MSPNPPPIAVTYAALRTDASTWEQQRSAMNNISHNIQATRMDSAELGVFALGSLVGVDIAGTYHALVEKFTKLTQQGSDAFGHISQHLIAAEAQYQSADQESGHNIAKTGDEIKHVHGDINSHLLGGQRMKRH